jgi:hypothetical protein
VVEKKPQIGLAFSKFSTKGLSFTQELTLVIPRTCSLVCLQATVGKFSAELELDGMKRLQIDER